MVVCFGLMPVSYVFRGDAVRFSFFRVAWWLLYCSWMCSGLSACMLASMWGLVDVVGLVYWCCLPLHLGGKAFVYFTFFLGFGEACPVGLGFMVGVVLAVGPFLCF